VRDERTSVNSSETALLERLKAGEQIGRVSMSESNELHVVFGSGPVGRAVMNVLSAKGKRIRLIKRSGQAAGLPGGVEVVQGDATDVTSTREVCKGATHVYDCTGPPDYHKWPEQYPPLRRGVMAGAAANDAKLIILDNLYMYGPHGGAPMTEDMPMRGEGRRTTPRQQMTAEFFEAHESGKVRLVIARASDFFGPRVENAILSGDAFRAALAGKKAQVFGDPDTPHTYSYMPDVGKALVLLGERDEALGQAWHVPNPETVTTREFLQIAGEEIGQPVQMQVMNKTLMRLLLPVIGIFNPQLRGYSENFYIFNEPYIVDHSKFERAFGDALQPTPLREAIKTTIAWYRDNPAATN
jgi:nucleoside-diphosphate-sugar epimerase